MKFFGIRYFCITDKQHSIIDEEPSVIFLKPFFHGDEVEAYDKIYTSRIFYTEDDDRIVAGCLFKSKDTHVISLQEDDFEEKDIENWEKLYFIIDTEKQIFACQLKRSIATPANVKNRLKELTRKYFKNSGYSLKFEFLKDKETFWNLVKKTDEIYEISFSLNAPNLFGADKEATGLLSQINDIFNIDNFGVSFKNSKGSLTYDEEEIEPLRDYVDSGGGKWTVQILEEGKKKRHKSNSYFSRRDIEIDEDQEISAKENVKKAQKKLKKAIILLQNAGTGD